eukprot:54704-Rhodomonas_salina.2
MPKGPSEGGKLLLSLGNGRAFCPQLTIFMNRYNEIVCTSSLQLSKLSWASAVDSGISGQEASMQCESCTCPIQLSWTCASLIRWQPQQPGGGWDQKTFHLAKCRGSWRSAVGGLLSGANFVFVFWYVPTVDCCPLGT